ncbi:EKC/KEOPS complex subunit TPRKB-like [Cylas formicarius]|uniref:EKC/KEOPS complex subunit TPRKB-like n=1 Tax=Cylas formicarius TaxID=197179 RepID=UPI002958DB1F|nr:EKC/KEOPS complex subunit TPRKB-like [Cylas formicarius]
MSYIVDLDNETNTAIRVQLYEDVKNTEMLKTQLLSGKLKCCIIKPSLILDVLQVIVAANKAVTARKITTKSIYTEILFNLSPSNNITQSLQRFGIGDNDTTLLVVSLVKKDDSNDNVFTSVVGHELDISELGCLADLHALKRIYKISEKESHSLELLDSIVSRIACKEIL